MNSYRQLSQEERYRITALMISRRTDADIARALGRSQSTICRELARNRGNCDGAYRADLAYSYATARRRRVRRGLHLPAHQWEQVIILLKELWSPEQISNWLKIRGTFTVSHETIYQFILNDKRHGGTLFTHLRIMPKIAESAITAGIHAESCPGNTISQHDLLRWKSASSWVTGREIL